MLASRLASLVVLGLDMSSSRPVTVIGAIAPRPMLIIHGDADRILPITASGLRTAKLIKGARSVVVKDGPHCITWTHADEVNHELVNFLGEGSGKDVGSAPRPEAAA